MDARKAQKAAKQNEIDPYNNGVLIDNDWKDKQRTQLKNFYRANLLEQIQENKAIRNKALEMENQLEKNYAKEVADMRKNEDLQQHNIEAQKKKLWLQDIEQQRAEDKERKYHQKLANQLEDENYRRKFDKDREVNAAISNKKNGLIQEYLNELKNQMEDNAERKRLEKELEKARALVSLPVNEKPIKCYNCKVCKHKYPLRMLNKKKKTLI